MGVLCPNLKNKQVKQEFDSLTELVGENAAYYLWDKYKGDYLAASLEAANIQKWNSQLLYEIAGESEVKKAFSNFVHRVSFDIETDEAIDKPIIDLANKILLISNFNDESLINSMAELGWALTNKYDRRYYYKNHGKSILLGGDIRDNILSDIKSALRKGFKEGFKDSFINNIINKLKILIGRIYKNKSSYFAAIDNIAKSIATNYDGYFDSYIKNSFELKNITLDDIKSTELYKVYNILTSDKYKGSLGGSASIRLLGTLYRAEEEDFHDLDFTMPYSQFSWKLRTAISHFYDNIRSKSQTVGYWEAGKAAKEILLDEASKIFEHSELFKDLSKEYDEVTLKNIFYTPKNGICFTFKVDGFPVDLFFSKDPKNMVVNGIKISHFSVSFAAKAIMLRPKDMQDIINFKKFRNLKEDPWSAKDVEIDPYQQIDEETIESLTSFPENKPYTADIFLTRMINSEQFFIDKNQSNIVLTISNQISNDVNIIFNSNINKPARYVVKDGKASIEINPNAFNSLNSFDFGRMFLHELTHHFTILEFERNSDFHNEIESFRKKILDNLKKKKKDFKIFNGLKNGREFISEIYTNQSFREMLIANNKLSSWDKFKKVIYRLLGFKIKALQIQDRNDYKVNGIVNEIGAIINEFYSDPRNNNLGDAVAYFDDTYPHYDEIIQNADKIATKARQGLKSRLEALKRALNKDSNEIQRILNQIDRYELLYNTGKLLELTADFIKEASVAYKNALDLIRKANLNSDEITNDEAWNFKGDFLDFYGPIVKDIASYLLANNYYDGLSEIDRNILSYRIYLIDLVHTEIEGKWKYIIKDKTKKLLMELADSYGIPKETVQEYIDDLLNQTDKDLLKYGRYLQSTKSLNDLAVRTMHRLMVDCNNKVGRFANATALEAVRVLSPCRKKWDLMYEYYTNSDGETIRSGNLVRPLNYGLADYELSLFLKELDEEYGVVDRDYSTLDDESFVKYNIRKELYISSRFERKFKDFYYDAYSRLSRDTKETLLFYNNQITLITSSVTREDGVHLEELPDEEYQRLRTLYKNKANLSNPYDDFGELKTDLDAKIAEELLEFNEKVGTGGSRSVTYTQDEIKQIIDRKRNELSPEMFKKWFDRNVSIRYSQELLDIISKLGKLRSPDYDYLKSLRSHLLKYGRNTKNPYITASNLTEDIKRKIMDIDFELENFGANEHDIDEPSITDFVTFKPTKEYIRDKKAAQEKGPEYYKEWYRNNHTPKGHIASYYTKMVPIDTERFMEIRLNQMNRELSKDSPLYNDKYNFDDLDYYQPKEELYDNSKAYNKMVSDRKLKRGYDYILETIDEANLKIDYLKRKNKYKLPQISGDLVDFFIAHNKHFKGTKQYINDAFDIRKDDSLYATTNFVRRADGTQLDFVPTPYVETLDNTANISSNLVGLVVEYARMAENYKVKNEHKGDFMVIDEMLKDRSYVLKSYKTKEVIEFKGKDTNLYKKYHEFLDMQLWGRFKLPSDYSVSQKLNVITTKASQHIKKWATAVNLCWNWLTIVKSLFLSLDKSIVEAVAGRYIDTTLYFKFLTQQIMLIPKHIFLIGNVSNNDFTFALLKHNEIAREVKDTVDELQYDRFVRILLKHALWGGWTITDCIIKAPIVKSVYANFRFDMSSGKFLSKNQFINLYYPNNRKEGKKQFKKLNIRAIDVITVMDGKLVIKDKYKGTIYNGVTIEDAFFDENVLNSIKNISKFLTNRIDGMLSSEDKTRIMTDALGSWCFMHRSYFINNFEDNLTVTYLYNPLIEDRVEAKYLSLVKPVWDTLINSLRFVLNNKNALVEKVTHKHKDKLDYNKIFMDDVRKYNISRIMLQWSLIFLVSMLAGFWLHEKAFDTESTTAKTLETALEGMVNEEVAEYPIFLKLFWSLISSFSPGTTPVNNVLTLGKNVWDYCFSDDDEWSDSYDEGSYEGMSPLQRSVIRTIPGVKGAFESSDIGRKQNYVKQNRPSFLDKMFYEDDEDW